MPEECRALNRMGEETGRKKWTRELECESRWQKPVPASPDVCVCVVRGTYVILLSHQHHPCTSCASRIEESNVKQLNTLM